MALTLPYPPALNAHWRVARNRIIVSQESRQYKLAAQLLAKAMGMKVRTGPLRVTMFFYRPRKAGDLDGRLKVLFDSMNGIAWEDDSQVVEIHAYRRDDKLNPRVEVIVEEIP